ncbi:MAG: hypothetical protein WC291_04600 [Thermodesulfovibrionales bacterium]
MISKITSFLMRGGHLGFSWLEDLGCSDWPTTTRCSKTKDRDDDRCRCDGLQ